MANKFPANRTWTVHPHGPLTQQADGVYTLGGSLPDMALPRMSVILRLQDGSLLVHNAIAADAETMAKLDALGPVKWLIVPSGYHRLDAFVFKERYPDAKVLCPRGATAKVKQVVPVDGSYDDFPQDSRVRLFHLDGVAEQEGVLEVNGPDGATLVFNDAIFNIGSLPGAFGLVYGRLLGNFGGPKITTIMRWFVIKDRRALREQLERLARTPDLRRILVAHGDPIVERAPEVLVELARSL